MRSGSSMKTTRKRLLESGTKKQNQCGGSRSYLPPPPPLPKPRIPMSPNTPRKPTHKNLGGKNRPLPDLPHRKFRTNITLPTEKQIKQIQKKTNYYKQLYDLGEKALYAQVNKKRTKNATSMANLGYNSNTGLRPPRTTRSLPLPLPIESQYAALQFNSNKGLYPPLSFDEKPYTQLGPLGLSGFERQNNNTISKLKISKNTPKTTAEMVRQYYINKSKRVENLTLEEKIQAATARARLASKNKTNKNKNKNKSKLVKRVRNMTFSRTPRESISLPGSPSNSNSNSVFGESTF
jgi:hypothetical protein